MRTKNASLVSVCFGFAATAIFLLFFIRSDVAIDYMKIGLKLCSASIIPTLFPFTVASTLLISSGAGPMLCRPIATILRPRLGISNGGCCAFILGNLCGFPLGAKSLCDLYDRGMITKSEFERVLTFSSNPGSAFVINALGNGLFGSARIGILLYACVFMSSLIIAVALRIFGKAITMPSSAAVLKANIDTKKDSISLFTSGIRDAALSMLTVCAMIAFFSSLSGCIGATLERLGADQLTTSIISAFFEMSGGVSALSASKNSLSVVLCAAALGWSGLSVHFQIMSLCSGRKINFAPYFISKILQGFISAALAVALMKIIPISEDVSLNATNSFANKGFDGNIILIWGIFSLAIAISATVSMIKNRVKNFFAKKEKNFAKRG